ncbi:hypothetical protein HK096_010450 [Nowakowskiella sp. JEL0078]|nr:hypothetical protein HK096_010450 [Nowakowskiella sp. JEL0078]
MKQEIVVNRKKWIFIAVFVVVCLTAGVLITLYVTGQFNPNLKPELPLSNYNEIYVCPKNDSESYVAKMIPIKNKVFVLCDEIIPKYFTGSVIELDLSTGKVSTKFSGAKVVDITVSKSASDELIDPYIYIACVNGTILRYDSDENILSNLQVPMLDKSLSLSAIFSYTSSDSPTTTRLLSRHASASNFNSSNVLDFPSGSQVFKLWELKEDKAVNITDKLSPELNDLQDFPVSLYIRSDGVGIVGYIEKNDLLVALRSIHSNELAVPSKSIILNHGLENQCIINYNVGIPFISNEKVLIQGTQGYFPTFGVWDLSKSGPVADLVHCSVFSKFEFRPSSYGLQLLSASPDKLSIFMAGHDMVGNDHRRITVVREFDSSTFEVKKTYGISENSDPGFLSIASMNTILFAGESHGKFFGYKI